MPYISPRDAVKSRIPPRQKPPLAEPTKTEALQEHVPSVDLGEVNSRDGNPSVVQELEHWKGWSAEHKVVEDEKEADDPLDEEVLTH